MYISLKKKKLKTKTTAITLYLRPGNLYAAFGETILLAASFLDTFMFMVWSEGEIPSEDRFEFKWVFLYYELGRFEFTVSLYFLWCWGLKEKFQVPSGYVLEFSDTIRVNGAFSFCFPCFTLSDSGHSVSAKEKLVALLENVWNLLSLSWICDFNLTNG